MISVFCFCKWMPYESYLKVGFTTVSRNEREHNTFVIIRSSSFEKFIENVERDFRKEHVKIEKLGFDENGCEYRIYGDVSLNFDKFKRCVYSQNVF